MGIRRGLAPGTGQLPPAGDVYVLPISGGVPPTRLIPSWWFGDGARLFNEVRNGLPPVAAIPSIAPLDDTLQRGIVRRSSGLLFGVGMARAEPPRGVSSDALDDSQRH